MSLDVYLTIDGEPSEPKGSGIFIRRDGVTVEIDRYEWDQLFPGQEPVAVVSIPEITSRNEVYSANITHNLGKMAAAAGIYEACWRPEEIGITKAGQLIPLLSAGLEKMRANPAEFEKHNSPNGWGLYKNFVPWVAKYLAACEEYPDAEVGVSR